MQINEKTGLYENYGVWHIPFWQTESFLLWTKIIGILLFVCVCGILVTLYIGHKKRKKRTPWAQALYDIQQLKTNHVMHADNGKKFYLALSAILKTYFFNRFDYAVLGKTDTEMIVFLEENGLDNHIIIEVKELLHGGVFVKFANAQVAQERINEDYDRIISIITLTIPKKK